MLLQVRMKVMMKKGRVVRLKEIMIRMPLTSTEPFWQTLEGMI